MMRHPQPSYRTRGGFTLVELLVSLGASAMIVLTATAGFRSALQAVSVSNRHFVENMMLRTAVEIALEEVDFWTTIDHPDRLDVQTMRPISKDGAGLPFSPFRTGPLGIDARPGAFTEDNTGWNPNPMAWAAWEPRTWFRGSMGEGVTDASLPWGNYTIYSFCQPLDTRSTHHWYAGQVKGLVDSLGFYGLCEYLPSNAYFSYHGSAPREAGNRTISPGGKPAAMEFQGAWLYTSDGGDQCPKGRIRGTLGSRYILPSVLNSQAVFLCRTYAKIGYEGRDSGYSTTVVRNFFDQTANIPVSMTVVPYEWPEASVEVLRFVDRGRMVTACVIKCYDAKNGDQFLLPFTSVGTTLRGARQQRRPSKGWVEDPWTEATLDYAFPP